MQGIFSVVMKYQWAWWCLLSRRIVSNSFLGNSSGLSECAGCARLCKTGSSLPIYEFLWAPIFSLRALEIFWAFVCDWFFGCDYMLFTRKLSMVGYIILWMLICLARLVLNLKMKKHTSWYNINRLLVIERRGPWIFCPFIYYFVNSCKFYLVSAILAYKPTNYPVYISLSKIICTESNAPIYSAPTEDLYSSFVILTCLSIYCHKWSGCSLFRPRTVKSDVHVWVNNCIFYSFQSHFINYVCFVSQLIYCR